MLPPYGKREGCTARKGGAGEEALPGEEEWSCMGGGGRGLEDEDVASKLEGVGCVGADLSLAVLRVRSGWGHQM
jgi:hypothetical protein